MKKNKIDRSTDNSDGIKKDHITSVKKNEQGGANSSFPQEYEEQRNMEIRMKPQPLVKHKKSGG
jgi:hypothetical protein